MKLQIVSDLHIEEHSLPSFEQEGDVLIVAGDTHDDPAGFERWLTTLRADVPVIVILGNHEYDHKQFDMVLPAYREAVARFPHVHLLECERFDLDGIAFLGANLWTDMNAGRDAATIAPLLKHFDMRGVMVDDLMETHRLSRRWLEKAYPSGVERVVVVTHTAPSFKSQHPRFNSSKLNGFFASGLDALVERLGPRLWIHGHMHDAVDYTIGTTRVISNPRGYAGENANWSPVATVLEV
ncbi:MAG: metallophosphoesterase [Candidatus Eremiobacteraeota bacterium]|nr:metallophosphoesterase [Candidatus Eremiobacteraeota bacterium]